MNEDNRAAFRSGLSDLGYVEGQTFAIEFRAGGGSDEQLAKAAAELVALPVDVMVTATTIVTVAARNATRTIPIVFVNVSDPAANGLIASEGRPGGNLTGLLAASGELLKKLQVYREMVPRIARVAVLFNPTSLPPSRVRDMAELLQGAPALGVTVDAIEIRARGDVAGALAGVARTKPDALMTTLDPNLVISQTDVQIMIREFGARERIAVVTGGPASRATVAAGALMSYGAVAGGPDDYRRAAAYVDKILRGTSPAEIPVEPPTRYELYVNLCVAEKLGITIPQSQLVRVTEAIPCGAP